MESTIEKCVVLTDTEYRELLASARTNKNKEVKVSWECKSYGGRRMYDSFAVSGDFYLGPNMEKQIVDTLRTIEEAYNNNLKNLYEDVKMDVRNEMNDRFSNMPWYDRLVFSKNV